MGKKHQLSAMIDTLNTPATIAATMLSAPIISGIVSLSLTQAVIAGVISIFTTASFSAGGLVLGTLTNHNKPDAPIHPHHLTKYAKKGALTGAFLAATLTISASCLINNAQQDTEKHPKKDRITNHLLP